MSQPKEPLTLATLEQASNEELLAFIKANSNSALLQSAMASRRKTIESGGDANLSPDEFKKTRADLLRKAAEIIHKTQVSPKKSQQAFSKTDYTVISVLNERQAKFLMERDANARRKDLFVGAAEDLQTFIQTTLKALLTTAGNTTAEKAPMRMMMDPGLMAQIGKGKKLNKVRQDSASSLETGSSADSTSASDNDSDIESDNEAAPASMRSRLQSVLSKGQKAKPVEAKPVKAAQQIKQEKISEINSLLTEIRFLTGAPPKEIAALIQELQGIKKQVAEYKGQIDIRLAEIEILQAAAKPKSSNLSVEEKIVAANFAKAVTAEENAALSEEKRQEIISKVAARIKVMRQMENTDLIMHLIKSLVVNEVKIGAKSFEKGTAKQKQDNEQSTEAQLMKEMGEKLLVRAILGRYKGDVEFNAQIKAYLAEKEATLDQEVTFEVAFADPKMHAEIVSIYNERMDEIAKADEAEIAERLKREAELAAERARQAEAETRSLLESEGITFTTGSVAEFTRDLQAKLTQAIALARRDLITVPDIIKGLDRTIAKAKAEAKADQPPLHKVLSERRGSMVMSPDAAMVDGATAQGVKLSAEQKRSQEMEFKLIASYQSLLPFLQRYAEQLLLINENLKTKKRTSGAAEQKLNAEELGKIIKELKHRQSYESRTMNKKEVDSLISMTIKVVKISEKLKIPPKQSFILFRALSKVLDKVAAFVHGVQVLFGLRKQATVSRSSLEELELAKQQVLNTVQNLRPTHGL